MPRRVDSQSSLCAHVRMLELDKEAKGNKLKEKGQRSVKKQHRRFPSGKEPKELRKIKGEGSGKVAKGEGLGKEAEQLGEKLTRYVPQFTRAFQELMGFIPFNPYSHRKFELIDRKILKILDEPIQQLDRVPEGKFKNRVYFSPIKYCGLMKVVEKAVKKYVLGQLYTEPQDYHCLVSKANYIYFILGHLYFITFDLIKEEKVFCTIQACVYCPFVGERLWNVWSIEYCYHGDVEVDDGSRTIREGEGEGEGEEDDDDDDGWETESFKAFDGKFSGDPFDYNDPDSIDELGMLTLEVNNKNENFLVPEAAQIAVDAYNEKMGFRKLRLDHVCGANIAWGQLTNSFYITLEATLVSNRKKQKKRTFVTNVLLRVTSDFVHRVRAFKATQNHSRDQRSRCMKFGWKQPDGK